MRRKRTPKKKKYGYSLLPDGQIKKSLKASEFKYFQEKTLNSKDSQFDMISLRALGLTKGGDLLPDVRRWWCNMKHSSQRAGIRLPTTMDQGGILNML